MWEPTFTHLSEDPDFEYGLIDAMLVRVHQPGTGANAGHKVVIGKSQGGLAIKIAAIVDALPAIAS